MKTEYKTFSEFYPFYISQHSNETNRRLHIIGTTLAIFLLIRWIVYFSFTSAGLVNFLICPIVGYSFAWVGHFVFEKNKPATFKYPIFSFMGDMRMLTETLIGKRKF
jgi:hypothetical protein